MKIDVGGITLEYTDSGSGKCIVFLHGWGADMTCFRAIAKALEPFCRIILLDLPGHGGSTKPPHPFGVSDFADVVTAFLTVVGAEAPILVGHSNGGRVVIWMLSHGFAASSCVLIDSAGVIPKRTAAYKLRVLRYKLAKTAIKLFYGKRADEKLEEFRSSHGSADYRAASGVMRDTMVRLVNTDLVPFLPLVSVPALLVWGENDTATPLSDGRLMEKLIPDAGLVILKGRGHFSFSESPYEFEAVMKSFLNVK